MVISNWRQRAEFSILDKYRKKNFIKFSLLQKKNEENNQETYLQVRRIKIVH